MKPTKKKATFRFAENLLQNVSEQAASQNKTATDLIEGFIREGLAKKSLEASPSSSHLLGIDESTLLELEKRIAFLESEVSRHKLFLQKTVDKSTSTTFPQNGSADTEACHSMTSSTNSFLQETKCEAFIITQKEFQEALENLFKELKIYISSIFSSNQSSENLGSESFSLEEIAQTNSQICNKQNTSFNNLELIIQKNELMTISELGWLTFQQAFTLAQASGYSSNDVAFRLLENVCK